MARVGIYHSLALSLTNISVITFRITFRITGKVADPFFKFCELKRRNGEICLIMTLAFDKYSCFTCGTGFCICIVEYRIQVFG